MTSRTRQDQELKNDRPAGMAASRAVAKCSTPGPAKDKASGVVAAATPAAPRAAPRANRAPSVAARSVRRASDQAARIAELKVKLRDDDYMDGAILRIATVLSARLTLR